MRVSTDIIGRRSETVNEIKVGRGGGGERRGKEGQRLNGGMKISETNERTNERRKRGGGEEMEERRKRK